MPQLWSKLEKREVHSSVTVVELYLFQALSTPVLAAVGERYYKVTAEALRVCGELVKAVRPNFDNVRLPSILETKGGSCSDLISELQQEITQSVFKLYCLILDMTPFWMKVWLIWYALEFGIKVAYHMQHLQTANGGWDAPTRPVGHFYIRICADWCIEWELALTTKIVLPGFSETSDLVANFHL